MDIAMKDTEKSRYSDKSFERKNCLVEWLAKTGEEMAKKNRKLLIENRKLQSEIEEFRKINFTDWTTGIHKGKK